MNYKAFRGKLIATVVVALAMISVSAEAHPPSYEWVEALGSTHDMSPNGSTSLSLHGWRHVRTVEVTAEALGGSASFDVIVNNEVRKTISLPCPNGCTSRVVTPIHVGETTDKIEFRNRSSYHTVRLLHVRTQRDVEPCPPDDYIPASSGGLWPVLNSPLEVVERAIALVDSIGVKDADPVTEYDRYLLPIKIAAGRLKSKITGRGRDSRRQDQLIDEFCKQIQDAQPFINSAMRKGDLFDRVAELLSLKDRMEDLVD